MSTLTKGILEGESIDDESNIARIIRGFTFLTMGKVLAINDDYTINVYTKSTILFNVEVISIGVGKTAIYAQPDEGDTVAVFCFRNVQTAMDNEEESFSTEVYDMSLLKAIPVAGTNTDLQINLSKGGLVINKTDADGKTLSNIILSNKSGTLSVETSCNKVILDATNTSKKNTVTLNNAGYSMVTESAINITTNSTCKVTIGNSNMTIGAALTCIIDTIGNLTPTCGWVTPPSTVFALVKQSINNTFG